MFLSTASKGQNRVYGAEVTRDEHSFQDASGLISHFSTTKALFGAANLLNCKVSTSRKPTCSTVSLLEASYQLVVIPAS